MTVQVGDEFLRGSYPYGFAFGTKVHTLGLERRLGSCSSRLGKELKDLKEEDQRLTIILTTRVPSFPFLMFYLNFGMYQTFIMF